MGSVFFVYLSLFCEAEFVDEMQAELPVTPLYLPAKAEYMCVQSLVYNYQTLLSFLHLSNYVNIKHTVLYGTICNKIAKQEIKKYS